MKVGATPRIVGDPSITDEFRRHAYAINQVQEAFNLFGALPSYADDSAAAAGGLPLYAFYRTGSTVKQRIA